MLSFNEYQKEALRTANPECRDLTNAALGLCGESAEFMDLLMSKPINAMSEQHLAKELGDVAWYVAVASYVLGYDLDDHTGFMYASRVSSPNERQQLVMDRLAWGDNDQVNCESLARRLTILCGSFADRIKKHRFQGHELNRVEAMTTLSVILDVLAALFYKIGYSFEDGLQMNVDKLRKRYPDGFDVEKSLHRDKDDV